MTLHKPERGDHLSMVNLTVTIRIEEIKRGAGLMSAHRRLRQ